MSTFNISLQFFLQLAVVLMVYRMMSGRIAWVGQTMPKADRVWGMAVPGKLRSAA